MAEKITFLFGAGASANCLPIVQEIPNRLANFQKFITENRSALDKELYGHIKQVDAEEMLINSCKEVIQILDERQHASIDTYAKRLRLTAPHTGVASLKYNALKALLSCFFIYEQLKNKPDYRYDSFFASILSERHTDFPENVRILTWNYDFQFEKAFSIYSGKASLGENQAQLGVSQSGDSWRDSNQFGIYKLNGTTSFLEKKSGINQLSFVHDDLSSYEEKELVRKFVALYNNLVYNSTEIRSSLSFAWEANWEDSTDKFLKKAESSITDTEILVVIGYSFPFFNRQVDRRMIKAMGLNLKKVYIQDVYPQNVSDNFLSVIPDEIKFGEVNGPTIKLISSVDQFFLPPEM